MAGIPTVYNQYSHIFALSTINILLCLNINENSRTRQLQFAIHCMREPFKIELSERRVLVSVIQYPLYVLWSRTNKQKDNKTDQTVSRYLEHFASLLITNHELHWSSSDCLYIYYIYQTVSTQESCSKFDEPVKRISSNGDLEY